MTKFLISLSVLCGLCISSSAYAQYKCVSKNSTTYSDTPPTHVQCQQVSVTNFVKTKQQNLLPKNAYPEPDKKDTNSESSKEFKEHQEAQKSFLYDRQACQEIQNYLSLLQQGGKVAKLDKNGERVFLEDKDREKEMSRLQNSLKERCRRS